jgi:Protein of unknown function (DUF1203)
MSIPFRFVALDYGQFVPLFALTDTELEAVGATRTIIREERSAPCRVSLVDAQVGETALLLPFTHHDVSSPYRASGPIFVRSGARTARPEPGEIPLMLMHRLLSIRAYDKSAMMIDADVAPGEQLDKTIQRLLEDSAVEYLHVHNARPGCYNCRVVRAA